MLARAAIVEAPAVGPAIVSRYEEATNALAPLLREGRASSPYGDELPQTLETSLTSGILWSAHQRLVVDEIGRPAGVLAGGGRVRHPAVPGRGRGGARCSRRRADLRQEVSEVDGSGAKDRGAEPELGPLLGGIHGLSREQVLESQRERLLAALVDLVAERGYGAAKVADIVKRASVSSRDFYAIFDSKEDCFLAALEAILAHLRALADDAVDRDEPWPRQVVAVLRAIADFFAAEPEVARFCLIGSVSATPAISARLSRPSSSPPRTCARAAPNPRGPPPSPARPRTPFSAASSSPLRGRS
jgi:AcrR family transcriptional regulator